MIFIFVGKFNKLEYLFENIEVINNYRNVQ